MTHPTYEGTKTRRPPGAAADERPAETAASERARGPPPEENPPPEMSDTGTRVAVRFDAEAQVWSIDDDTGDDLKHDYEARAKAVARARSLAQEHKAVLTLYDEDGTIEEQQDYGTMGAPPGPEADVTGEKGTAATARAEQRSMQRG